MPGLADDASDVYRPAEDTALVLAGLKVKRGCRAIDIGTGRGDIALELARRGAQVVATDLNPAAVAVAAARAQREGLAVRFAVGDLFGPASGRFDLVVFNPPYLPTAPEERLKGPLNAAFDGGADGLAVTRRFLALLPGRLRPAGRALTVVSSLSPWQDFKEAVPKGLKAKVVRRARFDFEELRLVEITRARARASPTRTREARSLRGRKSARSGSPRGSARAGRALSRRAP